MSTRDDIIDGRNSHVKYGLIYTEVLGWIDLGHAQGTDIRKLLMDIDAGESSGSGRYDVTYSQSMVDPTRTLKMGKFIKWRIKRGRSYNERRSIALAMMMSLALKFEGLQASFPINLVTDSGFSGEDLVSDLLGFYRVVSISNPFELLRPVSKQEALKRWDFYGKLGSWKNASFSPILFPDPEKFPHARPRKSHLPNFMTTIRPWSDFRSGIVGIASKEGSFIDTAKGGRLPYA
ncbi:hypothetical protein [Pluralibacter gergoviae]|uniref:Uncharacterized protein n=1 Tax=Pluralibacter gergoviae TaxID=61647 RepID=A0AAW8HNQ8_PLUGE|nr:hypothetical protein [Pluralibacter gergoviae]AIR00883.1 hypothetical protein LG71_13680 [Pluralibacter gergoviae]AVR04852.1 hypothetical protein A8H26_20225 [Pluralibacter gergoviae]EKT9638719.1 hypothetical protein [Pluralibacter gergoviae]EKV0929160.1 hypothetical protein [Pluralibacter gergoviae]EKV3542600.1 hypothetical protein [Pluralibacter gergoviae]